MNIVMGKAGRIVIPAAIREKLASLRRGLGWRSSCGTGSIELHDRRRQIDRVLTGFRKRLAPGCGSLTEALLERRRHSSVQREDEE